MNRKVYKDKEEFYIIKKGFCKMSFENKKRVTNLIILLISFLFFSQFVYSESTSGVAGANPSAATFTPVKSSDQDLYTGDMRTSISLGELSGRRGLSMPISISYSSGIRVDQEASWVGLGWNIGFGAITRSVNGVPDDSTFGYLNRDYFCYPSSDSRSQDYTTDFYYFETQCSVDYYSDKRDFGRIDSYYLTFGGDGGRMLLSQTPYYWPNSGTPPAIKGYTSNFFTQNWRPLKISYTTDPDGQIRKWIVTAEDGTTYIFDYVEEANVTLEQRIASFKQDLTRKEAAPYSECHDLIDNDGDGKIDYYWNTKTTGEQVVDPASDPGCGTCPNGPESCAGPPAPPPLPQCSDSIDNDGDGLIDYPADPDCSGSTDNSEYYIAPPPPSGSPGSPGGSPFVKKKAESTEPILKSSESGFFDSLRNLFSSSKKTTTQTTAEKSISLYALSGAGVDNFINPGCSGANGFGNSSSGYWPTYVSPLGKYNYKSYYNYAGCVKSGPSINYRTTWHLTEIRSPDFVDSNSNGIADIADKGNWIKISYKKPSATPQSFVTTFTPSSLDEHWRNLTSACKSIRDLLVKTSSTQVSMKNYDYKDENGNIVLEDCEWSGDIDYYNYYRTMTYSRTNTKTQLAYIDRIDTPTNYAKFITSPRYDLLKTDGSVALAEKLDTIEIYDRNSNALLYKYLFEYSYDLAKNSISPKPSLNPNGGKLTLLRVKVQDSSGVLSLPPYEFTYLYNPNNNLYAKDWWGYYNSKTTNNGLVCSSANPAIQTLSGLTCEQLAFNYNECYGEQLRGACRLGGDFEPDTNIASAIASAWSLTKIRYPTGGESSYTYEPDTYNYIQNIRLSEEKVGGGLRIKSITIDNKLGDVHTTTYRYGENQDGSGITSGVSTQNPSIQAGSLFAFTNVAPHAQNYVAYGKVTSILPGGYGYQSIEFNTPRDYPDTDLDVRNNSHSFNEWQRGQKKSIKFYDSPGAYVSGTVNNWNLLSDANSINEDSTRLGETSNVCQGSFIPCQSRPINACGAGCRVVSNQRCAGPSTWCEDNPDIPGDYSGQCKAVGSNYTKCRATAGGVGGSEGFYIPNTSPPLWIYYGQACSVTGPPCAQYINSGDCANGGGIGSLVGVCAWVDQLRCTDTNPPTRYCNQITSSDCDEKHTGCSAANDKIVSSGWPRLVQETSTIDGITNTVDYDYNAKNGLVMRKTETNSDGKKRISFNMYTVDFPDAASGAGIYPRFYPEMIAKNMISIPVLVETYKDAKTGDNKLTQVHTYYKNFGALGEQRWYVDEKNEQRLLYTAGAPIYDAIIKTIFNAYDSYGNLLTSTDPNGNIIETRYDLTYNARPVKGWNSVIGSSTAPAWELTYDNFGSVITSKDANIQATTYIYDTLGRLTSVKKPTETTPTTTYAYNYVGSAISDQNLNYVNTKQSIRTGIELNTFTYADGLGVTLNNTLKKVDPGQQNDELFSNVEYNEIGKVKKTPTPFFKTAPSTRATQNIYKADPLARLDKIIPPGSPGDTFVKYDYLNDAALGQRVVKITDEEGKVTQSFYDKLGNLVKATDPAGYNSTYEYDTLGRLTKVTNPEGRITANKYDSLGRLLQTDSPDFGTITYTYDLNGNKLTKTQNAKTINYTYDGLDRLIEITYPAPESDSVTYQYDSAPSAPCPSRTTYPKGKLSKITDRSGTTCIYYDQKGQLDYKTQIIDLKTYNFDFDYDLAGNLIQVNDPVGVITAYTYNSLNQLESLTSKDKTVNYNYNPTGSIDKITFPNSVSTTYLYNPREWVTNIQTSGLKDQSGSPLVFSDIVDYDRVGNVITRTDNIGTSVFSYDNLYRLTSVNPPTGQPITGVYDIFSYTYDKIGNRLSENNNIYSYTPSTNRLFGVSNSPYNTISTSFTYDSNGNIISQTKRDESTFCKTKVASAGHYFLYGLDMPIGTQVRVVYDVQKDDDLLSHHYEWDAVVSPYSGPEKCGPDFFATTSVDLNDANKFTGYLGSSTPPPEFYTTTHKDSYFRVYSASTHTTTYSFNTNNELTKIAYDDGTCNKFVYDADGNRVKKTESKDFDFGIVSILSTSATFPISKPTAIGSDTAGNVYVVSGDTNSGAVYKCNSALTLCSVLINSLKYATALAVDKLTGDILVNHKNSAVDTLHVVYRIDSNTGNILNGAGYVFTKDVVGLTSDSAGRLYVGTINGYVEVYTSGIPTLIQSKFVGSAKIYSLDLDFLGNVYIVTGDLTNKIIKLKSTTLDILKTYGSGSLSCQYNANPRGVSLSDKGYVFVVDSVGQRLYKLDPSLQGYKLEIFGVCQSAGSDANHLSSPSGVEVNSNGIYVADTANDRILKFNSSKKGYITRYISGGDVEYQENEIDNNFNCAT